MKYSFENGLVYSEPKYENKRYYNVLISPLCKFQTGGTRAEFSDFQAKPGGVDYSNVKISISIQMVLEFFLDDFQSRWSYWNFSLEKAKCMLLLCGFGEFGSPQWVLRKVFV